MCFLLLGKSLDDMKNETVYTVGLGYVGLPLAKTFVMEKNKSVESALISVLKEFL